MFVFIDTRNCPYLNWKPYVVWDLGCSVKVSTISCWILRDTCRTKVKLCRPSLTTRNNVFEFYYYTNLWILGCEYGDRVSGCTTFLCQQIAYAHQCCGTCNNDSVVTIPSEEPTTPKYENPCKTTTTTLKPSLTSTSETTSIYVFRLTITLNIDILTNLSNGNEKAKVIFKIQAEVRLDIKS